MTASVRKTPSFEKDITAMEKKKLPELEGGKEVTFAEKQTEAEIEDKTQAFSISNSVNFWLNLPEVPFNALMMMHNTTQIRKLTQVSSSLKKRITENILENPAKKKILRAQMKRAMGHRMFPSFFPSNEEIINAMWLSKMKSLIEFRCSHFLMLSVRIGILDKEVVRRVVKRVRKEAKDRYGWNGLECITCVAALTHHHHILCKIDSIVVIDVDLSTVPTSHLMSLVSSVTDTLLVEDVTGCDLVTLLDLVQCVRIIIKRQILKSEETQALVRAMESRVEKVRLDDVELDMETLTEYSGQGSCLVLDYETDEIATDVKNVGKLKTWATENTWMLNHHDHHGLHHSYGFRHPSAVFSSILFVFQ